MPWRPIDTTDRFPTLGYDVADWLEANLLMPDIGERQPFIPTAEQLDFLVQLYRLDEDTCTRLRHRAVLSRPRGWGKSPFAAAIACAELLGPVCPAGWDAAGQPVGQPWSTRRFALVQIAATTEVQALGNTWSCILDMLRGSPAEANYGLDVMDTFVAAPRGRLDTITSSATSATGARAVAAILDQTETWLPGNRGPKLAQVMRNNATKLGGVTLETPNAFTEGEQSVAETSARFAEQVRLGKVRPEAARVLLYDHREAPADTDVDDYASLVKGLRFAYGDSAQSTTGCTIHEPPCPPTGWVDIDRIAVDFYDTSNDPDKMAADYLNQIGSASDAWLTAPEVRAIVDTDKAITAHEPITLGFDGSEGRSRGIADSTVLVGYSLTQNHLFVLGCWEQPDGPKGEGWSPPRLEIEQRVAQVFADYNVVGMLADPSAGWAEDVKSWEASYSRKLKVRMSPGEPIRYPQRNVSATCEAFKDLEAAIRRGPGSITYDGHPRMTAHMLNARKDPRRAGYVLAKALDNMDYGKIDLCYGAMYAYRIGLMGIGKGLAKPRTRRKPPRKLY